MDGMHQNHHQDAERVMIIWNDTEQRGWMLISLGKFFVSYLFSWVILFCSSLYDAVGSSLDEFGY